MRDLGYIEGRDWILEERDAGGELDRIDGLVADLAAVPVDVLVAVGDAAARPAHQKIKNIQS